MKNNIKLRPATMSDAEFLFKLRNDPETRKASRDSEKIIWKDHLEWLHKSLINPNRQIWIAWDEGITMSFPVGTCRSDYEKKDNCYEISWAVAYGARNQGVGKDMVKILAWRLQLENKNLRAEIKLDNTASIKIAEFVGMKFHHKVGSILHYYRIVN